MTVLLEAMRSEEKNWNREITKHQNGSNEIKIHTYYACC